MVRGIPGFAKRDVCRQGSANVRQWTGLHHCNSLFHRAYPQTSDISAGCRSLRPLLHMELLLDGMLVCGRGDLFLSLPMNDKHLARARLALEKFADRYKPLIQDVLS